MFLKKGVIVGGGVLLFVFLLVILQKKPNAPVHGTLGNLSDADMVFSKVSFVRMREGAHDMQLTAQEVRWFDRRHTAFIRDVVVHIPAGVWGSVTLSGAQGVMDTEGQDFSLQGGKEPVSVQWGNNYTLQTASVAWSSDERVISTNDPVVLSGTGIAIQGTSMQASPDRSEMTLRNVHAEIY